MGADEERIAAGARSLASLAPAVATLQEEELADVRAAARRGWFTPQEDERLRVWFARYLTARAALLETIGDLKPAATGAADPTAGVDPQTQLRAFVVAYTAAALLVRGGRFLVDTLAADSLVQRKLNEAEPRYRIPRKQYTAVYRSLTDPAHAWHLRQAMAFAEANREAIDALAGDPELAEAVRELRAAEASLRVGTGRYVRARLRFGLHSLRRRRASATQRAFFAVCEAFGRLVSEVHRPGRRRLVGRAARRRIDPLLAPGDVLITRHHDALTNLFLPGYWPHASLHVGTLAEARDLGVEVSDDRAARWAEPARVQDARWAEPARVLEARKDGVCFRALADTLAVDAVAVIRPALPPAQIAEAISRAVTHEGKLYDFDFDFFRADRLVCTEVVFRGFDGVGAMRFELTRRAGRPTLSAEDLLDMALDERGFEAVAIFGADGCRRKVVAGPEAARLISASFRGTQPE